MGNSRPLLIFDEHIDRSIAETEAAGKREILEASKIKDYTGQQSSDLVYLCGDHEQFLRDDALVDMLLDKVLQVCGKFALQCSTSTVDVAQKLAKHLRYSGFTKVEVKAEKYIVAEKAKAEVGTVTPLSFAKKENSASTNAWKISGNDEEDYIDEDALLDEDDFKKPDPSSLRVCGTTSKRKACKDCSCGLAEELNGGVQPPVKSSCGSCYLGDAFRCASCPYMGTPAFKAGEKVQLSNALDL